MPFYDISNLALVVILVRGAEQYVHDGTAFDDATF